jgi:hypothetical protein
MGVSHHHNAGDNHNLLIVSKSFENVAKLKCIGKAVTKIAFMKKLRAE